MINCEKEICLFLDIPSIPKKVWNGQRSFRRGVCVLRHIYGGMESYAVCAFDAERDKEPHVTKVFTLDPFTGIDMDRIYPVPDYMETDGIENWDLDEKSKKAAQRLADEANELENEGVVDDSPHLPQNEYLYDHIHNMDEATAYIRAWNRSHGVRKGRIPNTKDGVITKLTAMWMQDESERKRRR